LAISTFSGRSAMAGLYRTDRPASPPLRALLAPCPSS
jgi:hypothetical protein